MAVRALGHDKSRDDKRRDTIVKTIILLILALIIFVLATIAWFTMSSENGSDGMGIKVSTMRYDVSPVSGGNDGIYGDYYDAIDHSSDQSVIVWQMTSSNNMGNYTSSDGIEPGSSGKISFVVTPRVESITLTFKFKIIGYVSSETVIPAGEEGGPSTQINMDEITNGHLIDYLNGHILLFGGQDEDTGLYELPILSDSHMERVYQKTFTGTNSEQVDIHWIWPEHLSDLVNAYDGTAVTGHPFTDTTSTDYSDIIDNIEAYPQYYFRWGESRNELQNTDEAAIIAAYSTYGALYDAADNDIGTGVNFILVKMEVSEAT